MVNMAEDKYVCKYEDRIITQGENLAEIKTEIKNITKKQDETFAENRLEHLELKSIIKEFIDSADNKYASKALEKKVNSNSELITSLKVRIASYVGIATGAASIITFLINKFL